MKKNVGTVDRAIRALAGVALLAAYFIGAVPGTLGIVGLVAGIALLASAALGLCGAYKLLGIDTCRVRQGTWS